MVGRNGKISFAGYGYRIGVWLAGETVEVTVDSGVVSVHHRGVLVATHAQRHRPEKQAAASSVSHAAAPCLVKPPSGSP